MLEPPSKFVPVGLTTQENHRGSSTERRVQEASEPELLQAFDWWIHMSLSNPKAATLKALTGPKSELKFQSVTDPLAAIVDKARALAKSLNLTLFYSSVPNDEGHTIHWDEEHGGDWKSFLECAKSAGTNILYMHWELFEESDVHEALTSLHTGDADSQSETLEEKSLAAQIEQFREKIGLTASIELAFIREGISHIYYKPADWISAFEELNNAETNTDDAEDFDNRDSKADPAVVKKWSRELASHPKYSSCRSDDQREFLLEQLAGNDIGTLPLWPILRRAETIYLMEIKEKEEENLAAKAQSKRRGIQHERDCEGAPYI